MTLTPFVAALALVAQQPEPAPTGPRLSLPARASGDITMVGEAYGIIGAPRRRPGQSWRVSMSPQLTLLNEFSMGVNILLSSEGSDLRQNISQFGLNPRYKWATFHVGDFSQNFTSYTLQGTRVRGAGVDLRPGILRVSLQGGQSQRTVAAGAAGLAYRRNMFAASLGVGREGSSYIDLMLVKAKDDVSSLADALADTTLLDTIPVELRPRIETRPQENLVIGAQGQIGLLQRKLVVKSEAAVALITKDLESPRVLADSVSGGALDPLIPLRLSSSGDIAYRLEADANLGKGGLRGSYEYVGAGYTSLGLAYLINDRRAYHLGGNARLMGGKLNLQGQVQHQNDNLLGQKTTTTDRNSVVGTAAVMFSRTFTASLTGMINLIANDATVDTFVVHNRSLALTASTSLQTSLFGKVSTLSVSYAFQNSTDANSVTNLPEVTVQNVSTALSMRVSKGFTVAPTLSFAVTSNSAAPSQRNVYAGFRASGRLGELRTSASATQTWSSGRGVFAMMGQANYTLPWESRMSLQLRHTRYDAFGTRPAFNESFATLSVSRAF